jgi:hypothetical protein
LSLSQTLLHSNCFLPLAKIDNEKFSAARWGKCDENYRRLCAITEVN